MYSFQNCNQDRLHILWADPVWTSRVNKSRKFAPALAAVYAAYFCTIIVFPNILSIVQKTVTGAVIIAAAITFIAVPWVMYDKFKSKTKTYRNSRLVNAWKGTERYALSMERMGRTSTEAAVRSNSVRLSVMYGEYGEKVEKYNETKTDKELAERLEEFADTAELYLLSLAKLERRMPLRNMDSKEDEEYGVLILEQTGGILSNMKKCLTGIPSESIPAAI